MARGEEGKRCGHGRPSGDVALRCDLWTGGESSRLGSLPLLFLPDGRLGVLRPGTSERTSDAAFLTPGMYVEWDDPYFKTHGFFERGIANRMEEFGNLVQVWSTYESRHAENDQQPFARGVNAIQIVHAQGRFWVASILWDEERPGLTLPEKYLK